MKMIIRPLVESDLSEILQFADKNVGLGYFSMTELLEIYKKSLKDGKMCSLVLSDGNEIQGMRLSYPPGNWQHGKGHGLSPQKWPRPLSETAYFQSLFLAPPVQAQGWGGRLSRAAMQVLKEVGAKGIVCHAWKESPHNSSVRYLEGIGFQRMAEYPKYWRDVQYNCTRCKRPPCQCTAVEMYLELK
jgi:ribosomal protein S18 acetylase RimI-like enzyme